VFVVDHVHTREMRHVGRTVERRVAISAGMSPSKHDCDLAERQQRVVGVVHDGAFVGVRRVPARDPVSDRRGRRRS
jgi:hypothetical protein